LVDFVVGSFYLAKGVLLGVNFESLYTYSFSQIYVLTKNTLPWKYADIRSDQYDDKKQMIGVMKKFRNKIVYADNACYDENDKPAYIMTGEPRPADNEDAEKDLIVLSPAGYIKWVVDGLVKPLAGSATYIKPLRRPTMTMDPMSYQDVIEEQKGVPVNFMLDWTRNLAAARLSVQSNKNYLYEDSGVDVTLAPFTGEITASGDKQVVGYIENSGYQIDKIKPVLYILAVDEPNYIYLAAIRKKVPAVSGKGGTQEYQFFDQGAVIIPYFDSGKHFMCRIFENGEELSLGEFAARHRDSFVHLCRVSASKKFFPYGSEAGTEE
ncbi:MAG: hypothetical protein J6Y93_05780, partial [Treponema sp.]|nr:hypothetical protein [Treponema sp.]